MSYEMKLKVHHDIEIYDSFGDVHRSAYGPFLICIVEANAEKTKSKNKTLF